MLEESVGHMIVVELYNATIIRGRLMNVETSMNLILEDVIMKDSSGNSIAMNSAKFFFHRTVLFSHH